MYIIIHCYILCQSQSQSLYWYQSILSYDKGQHFTLLYIISKSDVFIGLDNGIILLAHIAKGNIVHWYTFSRAALHMVPCVHLLIPGIRSFNIPYMLEYTEILKKKLNPIENTAKQSINALDADDIQTNSWCYKIWTHYSYKNCLEIINR